MASGARQAGAIALAVSNAWTFGLEEEEVGQLPAQPGFELRSHYTFTDMERMYFTAEDGTLLRRVNGFHCIVEVVAK